MAGGPPTDLPLRRPLVSAIIRTHRAATAMLLCQLSRPYGRENRVTPRLSSWRAGEPESDTRERKNMQSKFSNRLLALVALGVVAATVLTACGSTSNNSSSSGKLAPNASFKLGVSLTFNNTDFWTSYITYETQFAKQYNAQLLGPLVANNDAGQQITDIHT